MCPVGVVKVQHIWTISIVDYREDILEAEVNKPGVG
jgi:hypothetical protein